MILLRRKINSETGSCTQLSSEIVTEDLTDFPFFLSFIPGKACVAFHSYGSSVRCFYPLKNNPSPGTGYGPERSKLDFSLFREHEVRDACVQTDAGVSGAWSYASRGPALANQSKG